MKKNKTGATLFWLALLVLAQLFVLRAVLDPNLEFGDLGDGRFNNCVCEYWYRFFTGRTGFNDLQSFYPVTDTLAWSDIMLGFAIPYTLVRLLGADMFLAYKLVMLATLALGLYAMFWLLHRSFGLAPGFACLGAVAAFLSCTVMLLVVHTQLIYISMIPVTTIFLVGYLKNCLPDANFAANRKKRLLYGIAAMLCLGLECLTAFYVAYFHCVILLAMLLVAVGYWLFTRQWAVFAQIWQGICRQGAELLLYVGAALVWAAPFISLYIPILKQFGQRQSDDILVFSPGFFALLLTGGEDHYPLAALAKKLYERLAPLTGHEGLENNYGFSLVMLLAIIAATIYLTVRLVRTRKAGTPVPAKLLLGFCSAWSVWVLWLLVSATPAGSIWIKVVAHVLPGAGVIRAISRLLAFLILPAAIAVALAAEDLLAGKTARVRQVAALALTALVLFTQPITFYAMWTGSSQREMLAAVPTVPQDCTTFFVYYGADSTVPGHVAQHDAWVIALQKGLYTINGNSGNFPVGWGLYQAADPGYLAAVRAWVEQNGIDTTTLYAYDLPGKTWIPYTDLIA